MLDLVEVNKLNWQECINLPTTDAYHWVAPNVYSIAEAQFYPKAHAYCIYVDGVMVGFTMYGIDEDKETMLWIDRLMIAEPFRGQGYGSAVLRHIIDLASKASFSLIGLSTEPKNTIAKQVFERVGFKPTGLESNGEDVYHYVISPD